MHSKQHGLLTDRCQCELAKSSLCLSKNHRHHGQSATAVLANADLGRELAIEAEVGVEARGESRGDVTQVEHRPERHERLSKEHPVSL